MRAPIPQIDSQITSLQATGADALLIAATPKFAAQAIRKVHDLDWKPLFFMSIVSASVGAEAKPAGSENAVGVIASDPNGIRTRVTPVKGECPRPLDDRVLKRTDMVAPSRESASGNIILARSSNDKASSRSQIVKLEIRILDCTDSGQPIPLQQN
jgi:hypothetical protein